MGALPSEGVRRELLKKLYDPLTVLVILVIAAACSYFYYDHAKQLFFDIVIKFSKPAVAQVFYDTGSGMSESESAVVASGTGTGFQTLRFPLGTRPIRALRFDPVERDGLVILQSAELKDADSRVIREVPLGAFQAAHDIAFVRATGEGLAIQSSPDSTDPITTINISYPVSGPPIELLRLLSYLLLIYLSLSGVYLLILALVPKVPLRFHQKLARGLLFGAAVILAVSRAPTLMTQPRFWAEEGTVWFQHATRTSSLDTLLFVFPPSTYFHLTANLSAILASTYARYISLAGSPFVTTYLAFCVHILPLIIVVFGKSHLFNQGWKRVLAALLILIGPPATGEIWLNTINSMSYWGLATLVLLFEDTSGWSRAKTWFARVALVIAALTGVYAAVLVPCFVIAYLAWKEREKLIQSAILGVGLGINAVVVLIRVAHQGVGMRFVKFSFSGGAVKIFFYHITAAVLGGPQANKVFGYLGIGDGSLSGMLNFRAGALPVAAAFAVVVMAVLFTALWKRELFSANSILIVAFAIFSLMTAVASLNATPSGRYAFMPGITFLFLLLENMEARPVLLRSLCACALTVALWTGARAYRHDPNLTPVGEPNWSDEVRAWKLDHTHELRVWPAGWSDSISYGSDPNP